MATKNPIKRYDAEEKGYLTSAMEKEEKEQLKEMIGDDWIDVENNPTAKAAKAMTEGEDWAEEVPELAYLMQAKNQSNEKKERDLISKEPTDLQKKYEEMGLEYDYTKKSKKQMEDMDPYKDVEDTNPDFAQRNRDFDQNINLLEQIDNQYNFKKGQLEALQLEVYAKNDLAASAEGRNFVKTVEGHINRLTAMREAEVAKLDGQFYEGLPNRDRPVANMLLGQGIIGKMMSELTTNNGNIRDIINETIYFLPDDKKEEFRTKLLGDYVRDDQGNIVRNEMGEELRKGGDLIARTPYGTYDYKISENIFKQGIAKLSQEYGVVYDKDGKGSRGGGGEGANFKQLKDVSEFLNEQMLELEENDPKLQELKAIKDFTDNQIIEAIKGQVGVKQTPTTATTTGVAPTGVAPTTELTAEQSQLEEVKKSYLKSPKITELANGLLSYEDDLPEEKKQMIDEFNKKIEEEKIRKSGRSPIAEGTGLGPARRKIIESIKNAPADERIKALGSYFEPGFGVGEIGPKLKVSDLFRLTGKISDFLGGYEESGRKKILEEEAAKSEAAKSEGLFD